MDVSKVNDGKQPAAPAPVPEPKKTTPDEGKEFPADTVFVCVQECFVNGLRYRMGDTVTGTKCPPYFKVRAPEKTKDK